MKFNHDKIHQILIMVALFGLHHYILTGLKKEKVIERVKALISYPVHCVQGPGNSSGQQDEPDESVGATFIEVEVLNAWQLDQSWWNP